MRNAAIVFGSTGLVGSFIVEELLTSGDFEQIITPVRKASGNVSPSIKEMEVDFKKLNAADFPKHAVVFCAIGTTRSKTPDLAQYYSIDVGIPLAVAQLAQAIEASSLVVVSAVDAQEGSKNFYLNMKGEMERRVAEAYPQAYFVRPAMLRGPRKEFRFLELVFRNLSPVIDLLMVGKLKRYKSIMAREVARAMIYLSKKGYPKHVVQAPELHQISRIPAPSSLSDT